MMREMWKNEWSMNSYALDMWMWPVGLIVVVGLLAFFLNEGKSDHKKNKH